MAVIYEIKETYTAGSGELDLFLTVGNGQYQNTLVMLDKEILDWGDVHEIRIGKVSDCRNKKLFLEINATDANTNTNLIPVTIQLKDKTNEAIYEYEQEAKELGSILFNVDIKIK